MSSSDFNATPITARLIVGGGIVSQAEIDWLKSVGVTHIISAAAELDDAQSYVDSGLSFLHIPWYDDGTSKPASDFLAALNYVLKADAQAVISRKLPVYYVHCAAGHNRGPLLATFLLATLSGLPPDESFTLIKAQRPVVTAFDHAQYRASCIAAFDEVLPNRHAAVETPTPSLLTSADAFTSPPFVLNLSDSASAHTAGEEPATAGTSRRSKQG